MGSVRPQGTLGECGPSSGLWVGSTLKVTKVGGNGLHD